MKKKNFSIFIIACLFMILGIIKGNHSLSLKNIEMYNDLPVTRSHGMKMYDTSTPEKAIGISDYVFVAKVTKILRTEYKNQIEIKEDNKVKNIDSDPYTIYQIEVLENIKGNLKIDEPIEFMQYGGLSSDGNSYKFMDDGELLKEGEYYILMADIWGGKHGETIEVSETNRIISLGENYNPLAKSRIVSEYKVAYSNQVIPADKSITNNLSKYDVNYKE